MTYKLFLNLSGVILAFITLKLCCPKDNNLEIFAFNDIKEFRLQNQDSLHTIVVNRDITVDNYFQYLDSLVKAYNAFMPYKLSEHLLVRHNPWIIDTLQNTDYYRNIAKDSFVYNQKKMIALPKGNVIGIPNALLASKLSSAFKKTRLDINIPEYKLRIFQDSILLHEFSVRVGRDEKKYLKMAGREQDLRTKTGKGIIVGHVKNPDYYNPVDGRQYHVTRRDDEKITKLPQIPFIETEINGVRNGQLIHPTTNQNTLGKAYSNGCIGTKEADAWVIYYYTPIGTKINIRYDLNVVDAFGDSNNLQDVYKYKQRD